MGERERERNGGEEMDGHREKEGGEERKRG